MTEPQPTTADALKKLAEALTVADPNGGGDGDGKGGDSDDKTEKGQIDGSGEGEAPPDADPEMGKAFKSRSGDSKESRLPPKIQDIIDNKDETPPPDSPKALIMSEIAPQYSIAPGVTDRIIRADALMKDLRINPAEARELLDKQIAGQDEIVGRLATKLMRLIMAQQTRSWSFDQEDGLLDPARLARIVTSPTLPAAYRVERESNFKETAVTLLLDNSGSMDGPKMKVVSTAADIMARALERCGVPVEVLGWTTRGQTRYVGDKPARFDNLLHVIYKDFAVPYRRVRNNFGLMAYSLWTAQNVDGEALMWAYNRLIVRPEPRKILMVLSDGAPMALTSDAFRGLLTTHLKQVIKAIQDKWEVELLAIGACFDVTQFYKHAVTVWAPDDVGPALLGQLTALFDPFAQKKRLREGSIIT